VLSPPLELKMQCGATRYVRGSRKRFPARRRPHSFSRQILGSNGTCQFGDVDSVFPISRLEAQCAMSAEKYVHTPLDPSARTIRLLRFVDPAGKEPRFDLQAYDLSSCPPFVALSYTWGIGASSSAIELNGASFSVGLNLFCLLVDLQKRFRLGHRFGESLRAVSPSRDASRKDIVASSRLVEEGRIVKTQ